MATKVKGFFKGGIKHVQDIFVVKEHEMEIGLPTDVKHVAHIGLDGGSSVTQESPSWMNEFNGDSKSREHSSRESSSSHEKEERHRGGSRAPPSKNESDNAHSENQKAPKKKRRKHRDSSSHSSATKPSRTSKVKVSAEGD